MEYTDKHEAGALAGANTAIKNLKKAGIESIFNETSFFRANHLIKGDESLHMLIKCGFVRQIANPLGVLYEISLNTNARIMNLETGIQNLQPHITMLENAIAKIDADPNSIEKMLLPDLNAKLTVYKGMLDTLTGVQNYLRK